MENPFTDLRDALARSEELARPFTGAEVQVLLTRGTHFIVKRREWASFIRADYKLEIK